jgi:hypothetical protein
MLDRRRSRTLAQAVLSVSLGAIVACSAETSAPVSPPVVVVASGPIDVVHPPLVPDDRIEVENRLPGNANWYSTNFAAQSQLAVWGAPYAPHPGDTLDVYIHSMQGPVSITMFRIGWYSGLGARVVEQRESVAASAQLDCTTSEPVICPWARTLQIPMSADWISGIYLLKVVDRLKRVAYYPFVLSDTRPAAFTAVVPQFTWQAYNDFGGRSLYTVTDGVRGHKVSFERPYRTTGGGTFVLEKLYSHELTMAQWLERSGYNVRYVSDVDLIGDEVPHPERGMLFIGHDEYWTYNEFSNVLAARNSGTHLAFFSGNNAYRAVRTTPGSVTRRPDHLITSYNLDVDPEFTSAPNVSTIFRLAPLNRPENALYGIMFSRTAGSTEFPQFTADSVVGPDAKNFLLAAGVQPGDTLSGLRILPVPAIAATLEGDNIFPNATSPAGLQVLFRITLPHSTRAVGLTTVYHTTFFKAANGAGVFAAGFNEWGRWLGSFAGPESSAIEGVTKAVLDWMIAH